MADLLYLVVTVAFFAAAAGFVTVCDRIIGPDGDHGDPQGTGDADPAASTGAPATVAASEPAGAVR